MSEQAESVPGVPTHGAGHAEAHAHHFHDIEQQRDSGELGMWVFLATEILFFGGLFATYIVYRSLYFPGFRAGSHLLEGDFGAIMTFVLLGSSFTMAMAVHFARLGNRQLLVRMLLLTVVLGVIFLGFKFTEYDHKWNEHLVPGLNFHPTDEQSAGAPGNEIDLFFCFYFFMTALHATHMIIGIGLLLVMAARAHRGTVGAHKYQQIEIAGLYWHFVDIVWIFLFPLLYLIGGRG